MAGTTSPTWAPELFSPNPDTFDMSQDPVVSPGLQASGVATSFPEESLLAPSPTAGRRCCCACGRGGKGRAKMRVVLGLLNASSLALVAVLTITTVVTSTFAVVELIQNKRAIAMNELVEQSMQRHFHTGLQQIRELNRLYSSDDWPFPSCDMHTLQRFRAANHHAYSFNRVAETVRSSISSVFADNVVISVGPDQRSLGLQYQMLEGIPAGPLRCTRDDHRDVAALRNQTMMANLTVYYSSNHSRLSPSEEAASIASSDPPVASNNRAPEGLWSLVSLLSVSQGLEAVTGVVAYEDPALPGHALGVIPLGGVAQRPSERSNTSIEPYAIQISFVFLRELSAALRALPYLNDESATVIVDGEGYVIASSERELHPYESDQQHDAICTNTIPWQTQVAAVQRNLLYCRTHLAAYGDTRFRAFDFGQLQALSARASPGADRDTDQRDEGVASAFRAASVRALPEVTVRGGFLFSVSRLHIDVAWGVPMFIITLEPARATESGVVNATTIVSASTVFWVLVTTLLSYLLFAKMLHPLKRIAARMRVAADLGPRRNAVTSDDGRSGGNPQDLGSSSNNEERPKLHGEGDEDGGPGDDDVDEGDSLDGRQRHRLSSSIGSQSGFQGSSGHPQPPGTSSASSSQLYGSDEEDVEEFLATMFLDEAEYRQHLAQRRKRGGARRAAEVERHVGLRRKLLPSEILGVQTSFESLYRVLRQIRSFVPQAVLFRASLGDRAWTTLGDEDDEDDVPFFASSLTDVCIARGWGNVAGEGTPLTSFHRQRGSVATGASRADDDDGAMWRGSIRWPRHQTAPLHAAVAGSSRGTRNTGSRSTDGGGVADVDEPSRPSIPATFDRSTRSANPIGAAASPTAAATSATFTTRASNNSVVPDSPGGLHRTASYTTAPTTTRSSSSSTDRAAIAGLPPLPAPRAHHQRKTFSSPSTGPTTSSSGEDSNEAHHSFGGRHRRAPGLARALRSHRHEDGPPRKAAATRRASTNSVDLHASLLDCYVALRPVTVISANLEGFHLWSQKEVSCTAVGRMCATLVGVISQEVTSRHGVHASFHGDHFVATFNAARKCVSHAKDACQAALALTGTSRDVVPLSMRAGVATGTCIVGNVGSSAAKSFTTLGPAYSQAELLARMARLYGDGCRVLATKRTCLEADAHVDYAFVDVVGLPGRDGVARATPVGAVLPLRKKALMDLPVETMHHGVDSKTHSSMESSTFEESRSATLAPARPSDPNSVPDTLPPPPLCHSAVADTPPSTMRLARDAVQRHRMLAVPLSHNEDDGESGEEEEEDSLRYFTDQPDGVDDAGVGVPRSNARGHVALHNIAFELLAEYGGQQSHLVGPSAADQRTCAAALHHAISELLLPLNDEPQPDDPVWTPAPFHPCGFTDRSASPLVGATAAVTSTLVWPIWRRLHLCPRDCIGRWLAQVNNSSTNRIRGGWIPSAGHKDFGVATPPAAATSLGKYYDAVCAPVRTDCDALFR